jgi:hypothetical protein
MLSKFQVLLGALRDLDVEKMTNNMTQPNPIGIKKKIALLLAAYGLTLLLLIQYLEDFVLFPWGLFYLFPIFGNVNYFIWAIVGWVIYLALTLLVLFSRRRSAFTLFYVILVLLLVLNIAGCSVIQHEVAVSFPGL